MQSDDFIRAKWIDESAEVDRRHVAPANGFSWCEEWEGEYSTAKAK